MEAFETVTPSPIELSTEIEEDGSILFSVVDQGRIPPFNGGYDYFEFESLSSEGCVVYEKEEEKEWVVSQRFASLSERLYSHSDIGEIERLRLKLSCAGKQSTVHVSWVSEWGSVASASASVAYPSYQQFAVKPTLTQYFNGQFVELEFYEDIDAVTLQLRFNGEPECYWDQRLECKQFRLIQTQKGKTFRVAHIDIYSSTIEVLAGNKRSVISLTAIPMEAQAITLYSASVAESSLAIRLQIPEGTHVLLVDLPSNTVQSFSCSILVDGQEYVDSCAKVSSRRLQLSLKPIPSGVHQVSISPPVAMSNYRLNVFLTSQDRQSITHIVADYRAELLTHSVDYFQEWHPTDSIRINPHFYSQQIQLTNSNKVALQLDSLTALTTSNFIRFACPHYEYPYITQLNQHNTPPLTITILEPSKCAIAPERQVYAIPQKG